MNLLQDKAIKTARLREVIVVNPYDPTGVSKTYYKKKLTKRSKSQPFILF